MRIVVLGGAGMMGCIAAQDLARSPQVAEVVIADRDRPRAEEVAAAIGRARLSVVEVDVTDHRALVGVLRGADAVLNATVYYFNLNVMRACLEAGTHYTDLGGLFHVTRQQLEMDAAFRRAGLTAVLGVGSAPGVPNVQARYAADRLDTMEYIRIYDGLATVESDQVQFTYAVATILDEITMSPMVYRDGQFVARPPLSEVEDYCFAPPIGRREMHLSLHSEVATLPLSFGHKGLRECFFKIDYWGMPRSTIDKIGVLIELGFAGTEPVEVEGHRVRPRDVLLALLTSHVPPVTTFLAGPQGDPHDWKKEIVTEVKGRRDGQEVIYRLGTLTNPGSLPTGVAPSIAARWLAEGRIERSGVFPPEVVLEPEPFFRELERRGIVTRVTVTESV